MFPRIFCIYIFFTFARADVDFVFPDELKSRLMQSAPIHTSQRDFSSQYDNLPSVPMLNREFPRPPGHPCYYDRPSALCSSLGSSTANANANANSNGSSGGSSAYGEVQASSNNGFGKSNAHAGSDFQTNLGYGDDNGYYPRYVDRHNGGASSASSAASATSGIVNGVPVAASSASAAAAASGDQRYGKGSPASASASASASSSGIYGDHGRFSSPWIYANRIGGSSDGKINAPRLSREINPPPVEAEKLKVIFYDDT